ncbi:MAG: FtsX-like permease family protein [Longicatena sp.]|nr:FtsX-like permease family protein [Longicatena sp.]
MGATKFDVFLQFLIECFVILMICIILATILSINILYIIIYLMRDTYLNMSIYFSAYTIIAFFGMAILQCISLSLSTALNAVNVDIIQLLNHE